MDNINIVDNNYNNEKTISFTGKLTIDNMNKTQKKIKIPAKRNETKDLDDQFLSHDKQKSMINQYFLEGNCENDKLMKREIERKINGYKNQDIEKNIYSEKMLISLEDTISKLVGSKLLCYYCKKDVLILYKNVRDPLQWTLDRIDNDLCHSNANTVISCLHCNLQRRTRDIDKFLFTKQLKIKKI